MSTTPEYLPFRSKITRSNSRDDKNASHSCITYPSRLFVQSFCLIASDRLFSSGFFALHKQANKTGRVRTPIKQFLSSITGSHSLSDFKNNFPACPGLNCTSPLETVVLKNTREPQIIDSDHNWNCVLDYFRQLDTGAFIQEAVLNQDRNIRSYTIGLRDFQAIHRLNGNIK